MTNADQNPANFPILEFGLSLKIGYYDGIQVGYGRPRRKTQWQPSAPPPPVRPTSFLAQPGKGRTITEFGKDEIVFSQGDAADAVYYVQKGKFKATVVSDRGKEAVAALVSAGEFFGEACMAGQALRLVTMSAMTDAAVVRIGKPEMARLIREQPGFSQAFTTHILNRTIRVEADLIDQLFNSSERRLARLLLLLANYGSEGTPQPIIAKISQETLAEMIGTTRSRVSFFMNRFRKLGLISYNGHIEVHKSLLNLILHDQPHIKS